MELCNWQEKKPKTATALLLKRMFFVGKVSEKKKRKVLTSDNNESSEDLESKCYKPPPQLNKKSNVIKQNYKISTLNVSHDKLPDSILSSSTTDICNGEFSCTDVLVNENNQNSNVITLNEIPVVIASNSTYTPPAFEIEEPIRPNREVTSGIQKPVTDASSNTYNKVQRILQECTLIKMYVKSIDIRLKCLENRKKKNDSDGEEVQIIQDQLPIKIIDQLIHFDQSMENENVKKAFIMYVKRIGGANGTDNVKAIFKRIFTNHLGTKCSWLGQRNNFKICDLSLITVIQNAVLSTHYNFQEIHFQKAASEWFRLSKLRLSREQKYRHEADASDNKEN
ncbi:uncharacterized protein LOC112637337 [Camponotus floridanus]|uniref:uncharacterized protein LOC112637337 n=1 Tax=Camponotus floridanus TaxID=104421 RepID=UPI000DC672EB|nr:uncharacterized protein LOC112637337 [Camponotus floridanus]